MLKSLSGIGLLLGSLFFAASLTPSLVPRSPMVQGALGGFCFSAGYGVGTGLRLVWRALELSELRGRRRLIGLILAIGACFLVVALSLHWSLGWQNRLRALMAMAEMDAGGSMTVASIGALVFALVLGVARLLRGLKSWLTQRIAVLLPRPQAVLISIAATALIFWQIGNGVIITLAFKAFDSSYQQLDLLLDKGLAVPTAPLKTGARASLVAWSGLGREGRAFIAAGPDARVLELASGKPAQEPLRVYVGLGSADTPLERADLALAELKRIGAFERSNLVIVTPTGTGWVDPESQSALEYVFNGDVASIAVQYSYLASWIALLAEPEYGIETARAVFSAIYGHWTSLPRDKRPRLFLHGLSLGALHSNLSHDLNQVIGDPYHGALWSGPPFPSRTWKSVTARLFDSSRRPVRLETRLFHGGHTA